MQHIEPFYKWRDLYVASEDERSVFFKKENNEFKYSDTIYNYYIHPQWDSFGSQTLYLKVLYTDYFNKMVIIEFIGEWNDCIGNDIMYLKREIIDKLMQEDICKFILIGENILNFHSDDDPYYEEWLDDIIASKGWIVGINFRPHVMEEMDIIHLYRYIHYGTHFNNINWRSYKPLDLFHAIDNLMIKVLI